MSAFDRSADDRNDLWEFLQPRVIYELESTVVSKYLICFAIQETAASDSMPRWGKYVVGDTYGALSADVLEEPELATWLQYPGHLREGGIEIRNG